MFEYVRHVVLLVIVNPLFIVSIATAVVYIGRS